MIRQTILPVVLCAALLAACSSPGDDNQAIETPQKELAAETASFDLAANSPSRYMVGLFNSDGGNLVDGSITLSFRYLGNGSGSASPSSAEASFLPVAGSERRKAPQSGVHQAGADEGVGVYLLEQVTFSVAGNWQATASLDFEGRRRQVSDAFEVHDTHIVPTVGQPARPSVNRTISDDTDVSHTSIDSRAEPTGPVPDPDLHDTPFTEAIASGKPTLLVVATPTYCVSRFCGPITETVEQLQRQYTGRANFAHFEVWSDYEATEVNEAAADWILGPDNSGGNEPWVFLIGADGTITERWDNVTNKTLLTTALDTALS